VRVLDALYITGRPGMLACVGNLWRRSTCTALLDRSRSMYPGWNHSAIRFLLFSEQENREGRRIILNYSTTARHGTALMASCDLVLKVQ
jgi:hypothetical protein